jgi:hypothetical protein
MSQANPSNDSGEVFPGLAHEPGTMRMAIMTQLFLKNVS